MADNVAITSGTGTTVRTDDVGGVHYQIVKLADGTADSSTVIVAGGGVEAGALRVTVASDSTGVLSVDDNGASITVDSPQLPAALAAGGGMKIEGVAGGVVVPVSDGAGSLTVDGSLTTVSTVTTVTTITNVVHVDDNAGSLTVDGTFWQATQPVSGTFWQATQPVSGTVTADTELPAAGALGDAMANPTTPLVGDCAMVYNGTTWDRLRGDTTNGAFVNVKAVPADPFGANADAASATGSISAKLRFIAATGIPITGTVTVGSHAVTNAGTFATQSACAGDVAHDAADSGNPVKAGGRAASTARTAVADGDRTDVATDLQGRLVVEPYGPRDLDADACVTLTTSTSETTLLAAVASTFLDLIDVIVINSSASASQIDFRDTTAGTIRFSLYCPAGATVGFSGQRWKQATVNTNWTIQSSASVTSIKVSARFRKTK